MTDLPFNPLDKKNLGASVAEALLSRPANPLASLGRFHGAGIYALYYTGSFSPYARLVQRNPVTRPEAPIYVGKAVPAGKRKGKVAADAQGTTRALSSRLGEHAESIRATSNLSINDFLVRYLLVDDIWIALGEALLISKLSPVWNSLIDGFGNHDPGSGRYNGMRSRWDVLHPGRAWAVRCQERPETAEQIAAEVTAHLENFPGPSSPYLYAEQGRSAYLVDDEADESGDN